MKTFFESWFKPDKSKQSEIVTPKVVLESAEQDSASVRERLYNLSKAKLELQFNYDLLSKQDKELLAAASQCYLHHATWYFDESRGKPMITSVSLFSAKKDYNNKAEYNILKARWEISYE